MEKINETKREFFKEINKVAKPLGRLMREGPNKIKNGKDVKTNTTKQMITRDYY